MYTHTHTHEYTAVYRHIYKTWVVHINKLFLEGYTRIYKLSVLISLGSKTRRS